VVSSAHEGAHLLRQRPGRVRGRLRPEAAAVLQGVLPRGREGA
jgi:hypothetical protein